MRKMIIANRIIVVKIYKQAAVSDGNVTNNLQHWSS